MIQKIIEDHFVKGTYVSGFTYGVHNPEARGGPWMKKWTEG